MNCVVFLRIASKYREYYVHIYTYLAYAPVHALICHCHIPHTHLHTHRPDLPHVRPLHILPLHIYFRTGPLEEISVPTSHTKTFPQLFSFGWRQTEHWALFFLDLHRPVHIPLQLQNMSAPSLVDGFPVIAL